MITLYVVAYVGFLCPGGPLSFLVPTKLRPIVCEPEVRLETTSFKLVAEKRIEELGPEVIAGMFRVEGVKTNKMKFHWEKKLRKGWE